MAEPVVPFDATALETPPSTALRDVRLVLDAEIDIASDRDLPALAAEATAQMPAAVLTDASGVTFMDVAGLRAMLLLRAQLRAGGQEVHLHLPSPAVLRLLDWVRLGTDLDPLDDGHPA